MGSDSGEKVLRGAMLTRGKNDSGCDDMALNGSKAMSCSSVSRSDFVTPHYLAGEPGCGIRETHNKLHKQTYGCTTRHRRLVVALTSHLS